MVNQVQESLSTRRAGVGGQFVIIPPIQVIRPTDWFTSVCLFGDKDPMKLGKSTQFPLPRMWEWVEGWSKKRKIQRREQWTKVWFWIQRRRRWGGTVFDKTGGCHLGSDGDTTKGRNSKTCRAELSSDANKHWKFTQIRKVSQCAEDSKESLDQKTTLGRGERGIYHLFTKSARRNFHQEGATLHRRRERWWHQARGATWAFGRVQSVVQQCWDFSWRVLDQVNVKQTRLENSEV